MNDDLRELSALAALGAASGNDAERLADAAERDADVAGQVAWDRKIIAMLRDAAEPVPPPAHLLGAILDAAQVEDELTGAVRPRPPARAPRRGLRRFAPAIATALVAAAVAVGVTTLVTRDPGLGEATASATIEVHDSDAPIEGTAALYRPDSPDGTLVVDLRAVPPAPSGHHYQVWVLRAGASEMEAVGTFGTSRDRVHLELPLPGSGDFAAVDISLEENDGPPAHSGASVAGATFPTSA